MTGQADASMSVIPAKAGSIFLRFYKMDARLRGHDADRMLPTIKKWICFGAKIEVTRRKNKV
jgi:hypothetical protein